MIRKQKIRAGFTEDEMIRLSGDHQIESMAEFMCCTVDLLI